MQIFHLRKKGFCKVIDYSVRVRRSGEREGEKHKDPGKQTEKKKWVKRVFYASDADSSICVNLGSKIWRENREKLHCLFCFRLEIPPAAPSWLIKLD